MSVVKKSTQETNSKNKIIKPNTNTTTKSSNHKNNLNSFLKSHLIKKDDDKKPTNTRIPDEKHEIWGGKYHIPDEKYAEFLDIYYREVFGQQKPDHLTECQMEKGPILIDVDLRHDFSIKSRQYTLEHICDLAELYLEIIKTMYQLDDDTIIPVYVFEKNDVNCLEEKKITKDGIHIIISLSCDRITQVLLRKKIIEKIGDIWDKESLQMVNDWESVFDEGISTGTTNWQLVGSSKPNHETYRLTQIYNAKYDSSDGQFQIVYENPTSFDMKKHIFKLSARYPDHYEPFMTNDFLQEYNGAVTGGGVTKKKNTNTNTNQNQINLPQDFNVLTITNRNQLEQCLKTYLENIPIDKYYLHEAYDYMMCLPPDYYESGSYSKWFATGCVLRNISNCLFIVWLAFSSQSSTFDFSSIYDLWDKWQKIDVRTKNGLTLRSLIYWAKKDAPEKFKEVYENSIDYYIEQTLDNRLTEFSVSDKKPSGATDFDIATVLYHLKKDEFVCTSIKGNQWFQFVNHRWKEVDSGSTLRMMISTVLRSLYAKKATQINAAISNLTEEEDKTRDFLQKRLEKVMEIYAKLGRTNDKKNFMTECKDLFYDPLFMNTVDTNPYLLCFTNGVWDFKENIFRDGRPEDYISKCTNIEYIPVGPEHKQAVDEITDFMNKLFPVEELREYMWDHLSSTLVGTALNQTFNNYIGGGRNGKSVLVTLMSKTLGEYKGDLPLTAVVTPKRVGVGGLAPEIASLKGIRFAVMQEPKQGDILNEGILKELTSGFDTIQARIPYQAEPVRFIPQFKLVVCANVLPEIRAQDHGTWRRIRVVPFLALFTENPVDDDENKPYQYKLDPTIDEKFDTWKQVFMAMMVERVLKTNGRVIDCDMVLKASNDYKYKQDVISQFIDEKLVKEVGAPVVKKTQIKNEFVIWHESNFGTKGPQPKEVFVYLDRIFGQQTQGGWKDVRIQYDADQRNDAIVYDEIDDPF